MHSTHHQVQFTHLFYFNVTIYIIQRVCISRPYCTHYWEETSFIPHRNNNIEQKKENRKKKITTTQIFMWFLFVMSMGSTPIHYAQRQEIEGELVVALGYSFHSWLSLSKKNIIYCPNQYLHKVQCKIAKFPSNKKFGSRALPSYPQTWGCCPSLSPQPPRELSAKFNLQPD